MRRDSRLSVALHVLVHLREANRSLTSEELAAALDMNAVVLRRLLSALRSARIVTGEKGHGGGWSVAANLDELSLADVFAAVDPSLFAIGPRDDRTRCPIEQTVDGAIADVLDAAERLVRERLAKISVASVLATARRRRRTGSHHKELHSHA